MDLPEKVAGMDPLKIRDLFVAFLDSEPDYQEVHGLRAPLPRRMTVEFIGHELAVSQAEAVQIQKTLISEG
jgi:hypothetical protein